MAVLSKAELSALTLDFGVVWKPEPADIDMLENTVFPAMVHYEDPLGMPVHPLEHKVDITIPVGQVVLMKMQEFASFVGLPVSVLISRLLDMESTQYGDFDLKLALRVIDGAKH